MCLPCWLKTSELQTIVADKLLVWTPLIVFHTKEWAYWHNTPSLEEPNKNKDSQQAMDAEIDVLRTPRLQTFWHQPWPTSESYTSKVFFPHNNNIIHKPWPSLPLSLSAHHKNTTNTLSTFISTQRNWQPNIHLSKLTPSSHIISLHRAHNCAQPQIHHNIDWLNTISTANKTSNTLPSWQEQEIPPASVTDATYKTKLQELVLSIQPHLHKTLPIIQWRLMRIHKNNKSFLSLNHHQWLPTRFNFNREFNNLLHKFNNSNNHYNSIIVCVNQHFKNEENLFDYPKAITSIQNDIFILPLLQLDMNFTTQLKEFNTINTQCKSLISLNNQCLKYDNDNDVDFNYTNTITNIQNTQTH